jgi:hypothetical protein
VLKVNIQIAQRANLKNFWSGRWTSNWQVEGISEGNYNISGEVKVIVFGVFRYSEFTNLMYLFCHC